MIHWLCAWLALCVTPSTLPVVPVSVGVQHYQLEVAATPLTRERGLMERYAIGANDGMLFLFPKPDSYRFWMKNTHIPLDIVFVSAQGKVLEIAHGEPESLMPVGRAAGVAAVIELDAGRVSRDGIAKGDHVEYALPDSIIVR